MPISNITISNTFGQFRQAFNDSANAINSLPASIVTNVGAISPVASSGGSAPSIGLNSAYGDSQNPYASKTANYVLAAPNSANGFPSFRALVANDIPTILNTLTLSGTTDASNAISGTLIVSGGVGIGKNLYVSGNTHISGNTFISGNLVVLGSNTELSTTQINVNDSLLQLANNNTSDLVDIGVFGQYNSGAANLHSGLFRDASDGIWKLFKSYSAEPASTIDPVANNFAYADLNVNSLTAFSNVGIGTSSPSAKLDIVGASSNQIRVGSAATEHYRIGRNASDGLLDFYGSQTGYQGYRFGGIDGTWATINASGNLGLGVTPSAWVGGVARTLQVGAVASLYTLSDDRTVVGSNVYYDGTNKYIKTGYASQYTQLNSQHIWLTASSGTAGNAITFTQAMTLDASGLLTVGNTSPAGLSQITAYGAINGQIAVQNSTNWSRLVQNSGDLYIDNGVGGSAGNTIFRGSSSTVERMRLDASGNLGIGTSSPQSRLEARQDQAGAITRIIVNNNNATSGSGSAFDYYFGTTRLGGITHGFSTSAYLAFDVWSGSAATERMRLDTSGNLGIGTSSPGAKLEVNGNASISNTLYVGGSLTANSFIYLNNQNVLRFGSSANANYVGLRSSSAVGSNVIWTLPASDGSANQALLTNGSGNLSFGSAGISTGKSIAMAIIFGS